MVSDRDYLHRSKLNLGRLCLHHPGIRRPATSASAGMGYRESWEELRDFDAVTAECYLSDVPRADLALTPLSPFRHFYGR